MKNRPLGLFSLVLGAALALGCGSTPQQLAPPSEATEPAETPAPAETPMSAQEKAQAFLDAYLADFARLESAQATAWWNAKTSGKPEDYDALAQADLAFKTFHSDKKRYEAIRQLLAEGDALEALTRRSLEVAKLAFEGLQLPPNTIEKMVNLQTEIEQQFAVFRGKLGDKEHSNNELLEMLAKEKNSKKRQQIWEALKQVGDAVAPKIIELAKVRNEAARSMGYENFWQMQVRIQEHDPEKLMAVFDELEKLTDEPFTQMKASLDKELAKKFRVKPAQMMPWHYDNPFFQEAPPSAKLDMDDFFKSKTEKEIAEIARVFYGDIGLPIESILARSDLYERPGKDQHAYCITINRGDDTRTLVNLKPTAKWMDTMLHEQGHAVYYGYFDKSLPHNLRDAAHIFTTEGIAMLMGAATKNPTWLVEYAGVPTKAAQKAEPAIAEQRRREQLIFARWSLVMLHFEKALYENPEQDLAGKWYEIVGRFQGLTKPEGRTAHDWASKPHFTIAPVYYHNYMLGELYAAQLRSAIAQHVGHQGNPSTLSWKGRKEIGEFIATKVFEPGMSHKWPAFVESSTGAPLSPNAFASELAASN
jgi:peptidyl-dipeptidase A